MMRLLALAFLASCVAAARLDIHVKVPRSTQGVAEVIARRVPHNLVDFSVDDAHVTLYLTEFQDELLPQLQHALPAALQKFSCTPRVSLSSSLKVSAMYALWEVSDSACLQQLSNAVVEATYKFAVQNQTVPAWVYKLPPAEQKRKVAMLRKFGSPNVFSEFQPHVTLAVDTVDNLTAIFEHVTLHSEEFEARDIAVSVADSLGILKTRDQVASYTLEAHEPLSVLSDNSWDFFLLVREWPGTFTDQVIPSYVDSFTMHGMWPSRVDGTWPQFCNDSYPFDYAQIASIADDLDRVWYDLKLNVANGTNFWSHEWDKHGTCAILDYQCCYNEQSYFQAVIDMHDKFTERKWLAQAGIVPTAEPHLYPVEDFITALASGLNGTTPMIECRKSSGHPVIANLGLCLTKDMQLMDCPKNLVNEWSSKAHCGDSLAFPTIQH